MSVCYMLLYSLKSLSRLLLLLLLVHIRMSAGGTVRKRKRKRRGRPEWIGEGKGWQDRYGKRKGQMVEEEEGTRVRRRRWRRRR